MYLIQYAVAFAGLFILLLANKYYKPLKYVFLFVLFYYASVALELEKLGWFYMLGLVCWWLVDLQMGAQFQTQADSTQISGQQFKGWHFEALSLFGAVVLFFLANLLSSAANGLVIGAPQLAVTSAATFQDKITLAMSPLLSGALGFIENGFFLAVLNILIAGRIVFMVLFRTITNILNLIPVIGPMIGALIMGFGEVFQLALPYITMPFLFGMFHSSAYLNDWSKMIWATMMMVLMMGSYYLSNRDSTSMNVFHFGWNSNITVQQGLSIMGG